MRENGGDSRKTQCELITLFENLKTFSLCFLFYGQQAERGNEENTLKQRQVSAAIDSSTRKNSQILTLPLSAVKNITECELSLLTHRLTPTIYTAPTESS